MMYMSETNAFFANLIMPISEKKLKGELIYLKYQEIVNNKEINAYLKREPVRPKIWEFYNLLGKDKY